MKSIPNSLQKLRITASALLLLSLLFSGTVVSQAAGTPASGTTSDQLLIIQGYGALAASGDYISANDALNSLYTFYIEVPPGLSQLVFEVYDPDVGGGGANDKANNRDADRSGYNSCVLYRLFDPAGNQVVNSLYGVSTNCNAGTPVNTGDAAWVTLYSISNPASGHWLFNVNMSNAVTGGNDVNAFGIRAHDGTSGSGGTELNVYAESFPTFGNNSTTPNLPPRSYVDYPYITSGCQARVNDFDWDRGNQGSGDNGSLSLTSRLGTFNHTNAQMSANNTWQNVQTASWASDAAAVDYGIWRADVSIDDYPNGNSNYGVVHIGNYLSAGGAPSASPQPNSFRVYLPTDAGAAPIKPYLTQTFATISGHDPAWPGHTSRLRITVQMVNPAGSIGAIAFSATNTVSANVPGGEVLYAGNASPSQGSIVSQPSVGGSGTVSWDPGSVAAGATATLTYDVDLTPTSGPKLITLTGTPAANGTRAVYLDETGASTQALATFTFGPLCELREGVEVPTAVTLLDFDTAYNSGGVELFWQTAVEIDTLGFNILRSDSPDSERQRLNAQLVPAQGVGSPEGAAYRFLDQSAQSGVVYSYWLEVVNVDATQLFGPISGFTGPAIFLPLLLLH